MARIIRQILLRWDGVVVLLLVLLPVLLMSVLGFFWLGERGLFLPFLAAFAVIGLLYAFVRYFVRRWAREETAAGPTPDIPQVEAEPDWTEKEHAAFHAACRMIRNNASSAPWSEMPVQVQRVLESVAGTLSGGQRGVTDFTVPEALLLVEQVATRTRGILRRHVPFSDQLPVSWAFLVMRHQHKARVAWKIGTSGWRVARLFLNSPQAVIQETTGLFQGVAMSAMGEEFQREIRGLLLEEVAHAAVQLYSGRLRFSDAELLQIELESSGRDRQGAATPDEPVRILVVGQISAGKSTVVNAILGEDRAETDIASTTDRLTVYDAVIAELPCRIVDTVGLDGTSARRDRVLGEMVDADLVLWVVRADRPARAPDAALRTAFDARRAMMPNRRFAPVATVMTFADRIVPVHELPEGALDATQRTRLHEAAAAIAADLSCPHPVPVRAEAPDWNIAAVASAIDASLGEALMVQRNRRRLQGVASRSIWDNASRAVRGGSGLVIKLGPRWLQTRIDRILEENKGD